MATTNDKIKRATFLGAGLIAGLALAAGTVAFTNNGGDAASSDAAGQDSEPTVVIVDETETTNTTGSAGSDSDPGAVSVVTTPPAATQNTGTGQPDSTPQPDTEAPAAEAPAGGESEAPAEGEGESTEGEAPAEGEGEAPAAEAPAEGESEAPAEGEGESTEGEAPAEGEGESEEPAEAEAESTEGEDDEDGDSGPGWGGPVVTIPGGVTQIPGLFEDPCDRFPVLCEELDFDLDEIEDPSIGIVVEFCEAHPHLCTSGMTVESLLDELHDWCNPLTCDPVEMSRLEDLLDPNGPSTNPILDGAWQLNERIRNLGR